MLRHLPALLVVLAAPPVSAALIHVDLDATELPRQRLRARIEIPSATGEMAVWYPRWIPGAHGPVGPMANLAGPWFESAAGEPLPWERDPGDPFRFLVRGVSGVRTVTAELDYLCNLFPGAGQSTASFGTPHAGIINWNTVLVYPDGIDADAPLWRARIRLPEGWRAATAMLASREEGGWIAFGPVSLRTLIDSPLLCGAHLTSYDLSIDGFPPFRIHVAPDDPGEAELAPIVLDKLRALVRETRALFGEAPFEHYEFLVPISADMGSMGIEHVASTIIRVDPGAMDADEWEGGGRQVFAHELAHAWCGKGRVPAGLFHPNYHDPRDREMLWVYEGLTQWLGKVLSARSGFTSPEDHVQNLAAEIEWTLSRPGRGWRSLADTGLTSDFLRVHSPNWDVLRRHQEYYEEGFILWSEVDAHIRVASRGRRSLDDFCRRFFAPGQAATFTSPELFAALDDLAPHDWEAFFAERVYRPQTGYDAAWLESAGRRLATGDEPSAYLRDRQSDGERVIALSSLGLVVNGDGAIPTIIPGLPADQAGVSHLMTVAGVNGRRFSPEELIDAIEDSAGHGSIELLVWMRDEYRTVSIPYDGGPQHLTLEPIEGRRDHLLESAAPRAQAR